MFGGSFDPLSAKEVADPADEDLLEPLADKSMLQRKPFDAAPRSKMLGIIQEYGEYAHKCLEDLEDVAEIESRYMGHFLFAEIPQFGHLRPGDEEQAHAWIRREIPKLRAVLDRSVEADPNLGLDVRHWMGGDKGGYRQHRAIANSPNSCAPAQRSLYSKGG